MHLLQHSDKSNSHHLRQNRRRLRNVIRSVAAAQNRVDTVIIGAGIIGLAIARALVLKDSNDTSSKRNRIGCRPKPQEVLLIDRATNIGTETSSRNSEVIHAGIYYPNKSWKGQFCVQGKRLLYEYCTQRNVPINECGKLIVANTEAQLSILNTIQLQATANGVYDTEILTPEQIQSFYEPDIVAKYGALHSPSTGIVDSHALMEQFRYDIENAHCDTSTTIALRTNVIDGLIDTSTNINDDPYRIYICTQEKGESNSAENSDANEDGSSMQESTSAPTDDREMDHSNKTWLSCRRLINCSGLWATQIANYFHNNTLNEASKTATKTTTSDNWQVPQQYFCRGTYFKMQSTAQQPNFRYLIYPVPDPTGGGLGYVL
jgi:L-2-hydroxyglutarate oxidase LhgO